MNQRTSGGERPQEQREIDSGSAPGVVGSVAAGIARAGVSGLGALTRIVVGPRLRARPPRAGRVPQMRPARSRPRTSASRQTETSTPSSSTGSGPAPVGKESPLLDIAGRFAHDLRNPLTSLEVSTHILASEAQVLGRPDFATLAGESQEIGRRIALGVDELVEFARAAAGEISLTRKWVHLGDVVDDSLADARLYRQDGVVYREAPDRADLGTPLDRERFRLVVRNLVRYMLEYGRPPVRVLVSVDDVDFQVRIEDASPGMSPEERGAALERPASGPSLEAAFGTGLGLFVCRPIIEAHGGTLEAGEGPGGITTFTVRVPRELGGAAAT